MTNFDSRETWLSYRADWKLRYKEASEDVRATKRELQAGTAARRTAPDEATRERIDEAASSLQSTLHYRRRTASALMQELETAKERKAELLAESDQLAA